MEFGLGVHAVAFIIFCAVMAVQLAIAEIWKDEIGIPIWVGIALMMALSLYCTLSGTYLLYLAGKI